MTRAEKKIPTPHLHTVKPASAPPAEDGATGPAAPTPGAKAKEWAAHELAAGATIASVARALHVAPETVRRWGAMRARATRTTALVPVEIIVDEPATSASRALTLVGPGGYRVEGLTVVE